MQTEQPASGSDVLPSEHPATGPRVATDLVAGLALLGIAAVFFVNAGQGRLDWLFPVSLTYVLAAAALYLIARGVLGYGDKMAAVPAIVRGKGVDVAVFTVMAAAYVVLARPVGFWIMSALMLFATSVYLDTARSKRSIAISAVVALSVCIVAYILFLHVFYVPLPRARWLPF